MLGMYVTNSILKYIIFLFTILFTDLPNRLRKKLNWAVGTFEAWKCARNEFVATNPGSGMSLISPSLQQMTKDEINFAISRFIQEIRKQDGSEYPGKSLRELVLSIQMHLEKLDIKYQFLDDPDFKQIRNTLDNVMKEMASRGIGTRSKQAQEITEDEEESLWSCSALGDCDPETLSDTMVYMIGNLFIHHISRISNAT